MSLLSKVIYYFTIIFIYNFLKCLWKSFKFKFNLINFLKSDTYELVYFLFFE